MGLYMIEYRYDHALESLLHTFRPAHRQFLRDLHTRGILLSSGWLREGHTSGAMIILRADSAAEVEEILAADPFHLQGFITCRRICQWHPTIGEGAEGFDTDFPIS